MMLMARYEPWSQVFAIGSAVSKVGIDASCPGPTVKSAQREPPYHLSSLRGTHRSSSSLLSGHERMSIYH